MFSAWGIGFGMISEPLPRSSGGALSPVAGISSMLGAGASAVPAFVWLAGALPALTISGEAAAAVSSPLEGFVELEDEASASARAESNSSGACAFAIGTAVCEPGKDVVVFGIVAEADGFELLGFEVGGVAGADVDSVSVCVLSGSLGRPLKCAHPA